MHQSGQVTMAACPRPGAKNLEPVILGRRERGRERGVLGPFLPGLREILQEVFTKVAIAGWGGDSATQPPRHVTALCGVPAPTSCRQHVVQMFHSGDICARPSQHELGSAVVMPGSRAAQWPQRRPGWGGAQEDVTADTGRHTGQPEACRLSRLVHPT